MSPGDALRSFFPVGTRLREQPDSLHVVEPGYQEPRRYVRGGLGQMIAREDQRDLRVLDVIIIGEVGTEKPETLTDCFSVGTFRMGSIQSCWARSSL